MAEKFQDMILPASVVGRIIKEAVPSGVILGKDARSTINHAASVFILYLTNWSTHLAKEKKHKTLSVKDVLEALPTLDFPEFVDIINEDLEKHRQMIKDKKESKAKSTVPETNNQSREDARENAEEIAAHDEAPAETEEMDQVGEIAVADSEMAEAEDAVATKES